MDRDQFRNVSNLDLVKPNRIRNSISACITLLFAKFLMMKTGMLRSRDQSGLKITFLVSASVSQYLVLVSASVS